MTAQQHLTRKQQEVLDFLINHQDDFTHPPTLDELCLKMGLKSRGSLHKHIQGLISAGFVEASNRKQRGVRLIKQAITEPNQETVPEEKGTPFMGAIAAGSPIEAIETRSYMAIPDEIKTDNPCYILQIKGDSMIDIGIFDGDWVIIEKQNHAKNGQVVVALIDNYDATLKYIEQTPNETLLIPANKKMQAMHFAPHQVEIQGVLVGQMRSYK